MAQNMSLDSFHFPGNTKQSINVYFGGVDPALYISSEHLGKLEIRMPYLFDNITSCCPVTF